MPVRKTKYSGGYDVEAAEDCIVPAFKAGQAPTLIKTGIKRSQVIGVICMALSMLLTPIGFLFNKNEAISSTKLLGKTLS